MIQKLKNNFFIPASPYSKLRLQSIPFFISIDIHSYRYLVLGFFLKNKLIILEISAWNHLIIKNITHVEFKILKPNILTFTVKKFGLLRFLFCVKRLTKLHHISCQSKFAFYFFLHGIINEGLRRKTVYATFLIFFKNTTEWTECTFRILYRPFFLR